MKYFAIGIINLYQKYISPYKGFSCAYRLGTGGLSCSAYGKLVISKYGVNKGYALLKRRFSDCKFCSEKLTQNKIEKRKKANLKQAGFGDCGGCDLPGGDCGGCDLPSCDVSCQSCDLHLNRVTDSFDSCNFFSEVSDVAEIADDLELPERKKKQEENRKEILKKKILEKTNTILAK